MLSKEDFRNAKLFSSLTEKMLDLLVPLAELVHVEARDYVYKSGDIGEKLYVIKHGTVLIEHQLSDKMAMTAATLNSGDSFGFSALFKEGIYTANAVCADQCDLIVFQGEILMDLFENNHSMGFFIMRNLAQIFGQRLKRRSEQFVRAVLTHPEIHNLEG